MRTVIGLVAGGLLAIGAFYIGLNYDASAEQGPVEKIGERVDEVIRDAERAAEDAAD